MAPCALAHGEISNQQSAFSCEVRSYLGPLGLSETKGGWNSSFLNPNSDFEFSIRHTDMAAGTAAPRVPGMARPSAGEAEGDNRGGKPNREETWG